MLSRIMARAGDPVWAETHRRWHMRMLYAFSAPLYTATGGLVASMNRAAKASKQEARNIRIALSAVV